MSLRLQKELPCGIIRLSRPDKRNALTRQMLAELSQALDDFHGEKRVRGIIFSGEGSAFCAGMDLDEMRETALQPDACWIWEQDAMLYRDLVEQMLRFPKPIIAAINGPAVAGGMGLVLACDLAVAAPSARFGLPEPRRGIVAGMVTPLLAFRAGAAAAANLLLRGCQIDADEARRIGMVAQIADDPVAAARAMIAEIAEGAPEAVQLTKKLLNETIGENLFTQLSAGAAASAAARTTSAAKEGLAAFNEKRPPKWD